MSKLFGHSLKNELNKYSLPLIHMSKLFKHKDFLNNGEERTVRAKKNILASMVLKGIDALTYLLLVPVTLDFLNPYEYGIWLTLSSIIMWINSFDIGLGNGMRNMLAISIAKGDYKLSRIYVSTTFFMLIGLMITLLLIGSIVSPFIDWYHILSTSPERVPKLSNIVYITFLIFCFNFVFKFIGNVYLAMQLPAINNFMVVCGHVLSLLMIFILTKIIPGNLLWVAVIYTASPLVVYILAYPITFKIIYPYLLPTIREVKLNYIKDLFSVGINFFILQLSGILLFSLANLVISHMFGPESVTPYNISYRYFSIVPMVANLILAPIWSATTDAYAKGDIEWIRKSIHSIQKVLLGVSFTIVIMILASEQVYKIWINSEVRIPITMSILMGLYVLILIWSITYSSFLNGLGKLKLQTINTVIVSLLFVPLCYELGIHFGILGILIGMCMLNLSGLILNRLQFYKIIEGKAQGIWNK